MVKLIFNLKILFIPCPENNYKPRFLESRLLLYYILILLVLKTLSIAFVLYLPQTTFFADVTKSALFALTNQKRVELGLSALRENPKLNEAAFQKARDMINNDYFSHNSPTGLTPWHWLGRANYNYQTAGENLAIDFIDSKEVVEAWQNSPSHKANLLSPRYQEMGIAVLTGDFNGRETTVVVQDFGLPAPERVVAIEEKPIKEAEVVPKEEMPIKEKVAGVTVEKTPPRLSFLQFMALDYPDILQKIVFFSLILVGLALTLDIFIQVKIQDRTLILKSVLFLLLLVLFVLLSKDSILQLIPHTLRI